MKKDPTIYLSHILESISLIETYTAEIDIIRFMERQQTQDAVLRRIEIIGEAVKNLPEDLRRENPQVPWKQIAGTRDDYLGVDAELIWNISQTLLPELRVRVQAILSSLQTPD